MKLLYPLPDSQAELDERMKSAGGGLNGIVKLIVGSIVLALQAVDIVTNPKGDATLRLSSISKWDYEPAPLGSGTNGVVLGVKTLAVKTYPRKDWDEQEYEIHSKCAGHPNVLPLLAAESAPNDAGQLRQYIVFDRQSRDLDEESKLRRKAGNYVEFVRVCFAQMLAGVVHCNSVGYVHGDLRLQNFLIGGGDPQKPKVMLADFGLTIRQGHRIRNRELYCVPFRPPEVAVLPPEGKTIPKGGLPPKEAAASAALPKEAAASAAPPKEAAASAALPKEAAASAAPPKEAAASAAPPKKAAASAAPPKEAAASAAPPKKAAASAAPAMDLWALGCLLYELLTGKLPFGVNYVEQHQQILSRHAALMAEIKRLADPHTASLISQMLVIDPANRITGPAALKHKYFSAKKIGWGETSTPVARDGETSPVAQTAAP